MSTYGRIFCQMYLLYLLSVSRLIHGQIKSIRFIYIRANKNLGYLLTDYDFEAVKKFRRIIYWCLFIKW